MTINGTSQIILRQSKLVFFEKIIVENTLATFDKTDQGIKLGHYLF